MSISMYLHGLGKVSRGIFFPILVILLGPIPALSGIQEELTALFKPEDSWCVAIADAETGRMIYTQHADDPCIPASNLKIFVTTTGFEYLGTRFRYRTPLMGRGHLDQLGTWQGDLVVRGSGDPTFSGRFEEDNTKVTVRLDQWAQNLVNAGFRKIQGNLYGLDDIFDENYWGNGWPANAWCDWYTAPAGGLILNDSCLDVGIYPGKPGQPPLIRKVPDTEAVPIENMAQTVRGGGGDQSLSLNRPFQSDKFKLTGKISVNSGPSQVTVAINDPTLFFIRTFKDVLHRYGIQVTGEALDADQNPDLPRKGWHILGWSESPPLKDITWVINTRSQNLFADSLFKTLGYRRAGQGSWSGGEQAVKEFISSLGISVEHLHMEDGSGLSRLDRTTANLFLQLLLKIQTRSWFLDWKQTLAVSGGTEGSLRKRMKTPLLEGKVQAKTGFIDDVYCLSGYVLSRNQRTYAFSLLFNGKNHSGKHPHTRMEEALTLLARDEP